MMISAVAARKETMASSTPAGQSTKRKASQKFGMGDKKARKSKPFERSNGWNGIMTLGHEEQQDTIIVDSEREAEMCMSEDGNDGAWTEPARPPSAKPANSDSSEDDESDGVQLDTLLPQFPS